MNRGDTNVEFTWIAVVNCGTEDSCHFLNSSKSKWLCYIKEEHKGVPVVNVQRDVHVQLGTQADLTSFAYPKISLDVRYFAFFDILQITYVNTVQTTSKYQTWPNFFMAISPRFPPELEREIFEIAVHDKKNKGYVNFMLVAHRVHDW